MKFEDTLDNKAGVPVRQLVLYDHGIDIPKSAFGIDPGRNFGLAFVSPEAIGILYGYLHVNKDYDYAMDGYQAIRFVEACVEDYGKSLDAAVEGAAHSEKQGQANLAYIREGFYLGLVLSGQFPVMVPPNTARKSATGNGRIAMWQLLPMMNQNAADALGVALHASGYRAEPTETP